MASRPICTGEQHERFKKRTRRRSPQGGERRSPATCVAARDRSELRIDRLSLAAVEPAPAKAGEDAGKRRQ